MLSLRSYAPWTVPLLAGLLGLGWVPQGLSEGLSEGLPQGDAVRAPVRDDFDGDGYRDLAVGGGAGRVAVFYGGPDGPGRRTVLTRDTVGVPGDPATDTGFGSQLSQGDLDGDGYADLVAGLDGREGDAVVVWGGPDGLTKGTPVSGNHTQSGDFDGDGKLDLVLFRTQRSQVDDPNGSTATVWYGPLSRSGTPAREAPLDPEELKYHDIDDAVVGDVNGDGRDELALRVYWGEGGYGVRFYTGAPKGLTHAPPETAPDGSGGLAFGDVNGDGYDDFLVGSWPSDTGQVTVALGSPVGMRPAAGWTSYDQNTPGVPGEPLTNDMLGSDLAVGDVDADGLDDVAVGAIGKEIGYEDGAGAIVVLRGDAGDSGGLTGTGARLFSKATPGIPEPARNFGAGVRLLDTDGDGYAELVAPAGKGRVYVLPGGSDGVVVEGLRVIEVS